MASLTNKTAFKMNASTRNNERTRENYYESDDTGEK